MIEYEDIIIKRTKASLGDSEMNTIHLFQKMLKSFLDTMKNNNYDKVEICGRVYTDEQIKAMYQFCDSFSLRDITFLKSF